MRNLILASLVFAALPCMAQSVCEVSALSGEAKSGERVLAKGDKLDVGASVVTGSKGRVRLRCVDGSSIVLGDATELRISEFRPAAGGQPRSAALLLTLGVMGQKVAPGGSWEVRTPSAVTAVRGTEFFVEVSGEQGTAVHVAEGEVAVEAPPRTRGIAPRPVLLLNRRSNGTNCTLAGCAVAANWAPERVQDLQAKLAF